MKISIINSDKSLKIIDSEKLDEMVKENAVLAFHRADGWVRVGFDEIRATDGTRKSSWKDRKELQRKRIASQENAAAVRQMLRSRVKLIW